MINVKYKESLLVLNLILNTFAIFGFLFLLSLMLEFEFLNSNLHGYRIAYDLFFYVALNIVIYFISFLYLKFMFGNKVGLSVFLKAKKLVYFLLLLYYLVIPIRFIFFTLTDGFYGYRCFFGFFTPLWLLCSLFVFNTNLSEKNFFIFCCVIESIFYLLIKYIYFPELDNIAFYRTVLYLFFIYLISGRLKFSINCPSIIFFPVSFIMSLFGVYFIISYYFMI